MIKLSRNEDGSLWTPLTEKIDQRARQIADAAGSVTSKPAWSQAMTDLRRDPEFADLANSHLRMALCDGDWRRQDSQYFAGCSSEEQAALIAQWRRDDVDRVRLVQPAPVTGSEFEKEVQRTLVNKFDSDVSRYGEAMSEAGRRRPDLMRSYLRQST